MKRYKLRSKMAEAIIEHMGDRILGDRSAAMRRTKRELTRSRLAMYRIGPDIKLTAADWHAALQLAREDRARLHEQAQQTRLAHFPEWLRENIIAESKSRL